MTLLHYFFDLTSFYRLGQKYKNIFVCFLVQMKTLKFAFEINWPLLVAIRNMVIQCMQLSQNVHINVVKIITNWCGRTILKLKYFEKARIFRFFLEYLKLMTLKSYTAFVKCLKFKKRSLWNWQERSFEENATTIKLKFYYGWSLDIMWLLNNDIVYST